MFWLLIGFPLIFIIIVIVIALIVGRRDRKKQLQQIEENKKNLLKSNPKQGVYNYFDQHKEFYEYLFKDVQINNSQISTNIDIVYFSRKGLYLINVVGNNGALSGDALGEYWINKVVEEYAIKNPLYHNEKLIETFGNIVNLKANLHNVVICPNISSINLVNNEGYVVGLGNFFQHIDDLDDIFSDNDLMVFYNTLVNYLDRQK